MIIFAASMSIFRIKANSSILIFNKRSLSREFAINNSIKPWGMSNELRSSVTTLFTNTPICVLYHIYRTNIIGGCVISLESWKERVLNVVSKDTNRSRIASTLKTILLHEWPFIILLIMKITWINYVLSLLWKHLAWRVPESFSMLAWCSQPFPVLL